MPTEPLVGFLLALTRASAALVFIPLPGIRNGPEPARIVLAVSVAAALFPLWPVPATTPDAGRIAVWMIREAALGTTVGLCAGLLIEGFLLAAQTIGLQAGYSYASTVDPTTQADSNSLLVISQLVGGLLFFSLGLDREVLRAFAGATTGPKPESADAVLKLASGVFSTGLRLALPAVALLLIVDLSLALLGRLNAQLQMLAVAFPAKMLATLAVLAATTPVFAPVYRSSAEAMLRTLAGVLK